MIVLSIRELYVKIGLTEPKISAINGVDLDLKEGQILALVGETGAGKSLLAKSILKLLPDSSQTEGLICYEGSNIFNFSKKELLAYRRDYVSICFQNPRSALSPSRTIGKQISDRLVYRRNSDRKSLKKTIIDLLGEVGMSEPERWIDAYPHQLSGGMCQRVMIALAMCSAPRLLIVDEPTNGLDVTIMGTILKLFREYVDKNNASALIISHDIASISTISDEIAVMYAGSIVEQGSTNEVLRNPKHHYTKQLLNSIPRIDGLPIKAHFGSMPIVNVPPNYCAYFDRCEMAIQKCREEKPKLIQIQDNHKVACFVPILSYEPAKTSRRFEDKPFEEQVSKKPIILLHNISLSYRKRFGGKTFRALDKVNLELNEEDCLGIVGESGSGKSSLGRILAGLIEPTSGFAKGINFKGKKIFNLLSTGKDERVQMVFQDPIMALNPKSRVLASLIEPLKGKKWNPTKINERVVEISDSVKLAHSLLRRYPQTLSGGQAQRVSIGRALISSPRMIIFDEPTSQLDVTTQAQILNLIHENIVKRKFSFVFISHDLATVQSLCTKIIVLYKGRVVESGTTNQIFYNPIHPYTKALLGGVPDIDHIANPNYLSLLNDDLHGSSEVGCALFGRCPVSNESCRTQEQNLKDFGRNHFAACELAFQAQNLANGGIL